MTSTNSAYYFQKRHAKRRGIDFTLTYPEWLEWWGEDITKRGRGLGKLQMCRNNDSGPYSLSNIYKGSHEHNSSFKFENGFVAKPKYLSDTVITEIRKHLSNGLSTRKIAELFNTNQKSIMRIKHGKY